MRATSLIPLFVLLAALSPLRALGDGAAPAPAPQVGWRPPQRWSQHFNVDRIDADGDGYGVGCPAGPDADDSDPHINTAATVGSDEALRALLQRRSYRVGRIFYLSPTGNDASARPDDSLRPFKSWPRLAGRLRPGDAAVFRAGAYGGQKAIACSSLRGRKDAPIYLLAYPGERAVIDGSEAGIEIDRCTNLVVDGLVIDDTGQRLSNGLAVKFSQHIVLRNLELLHHYWGVIGMQDLHDLLIEDCVIHDNASEHGVYLGARDLPDSDLTVRRCLVYRNGQQGLQFNGRVRGLRVEDNVIHTNGQAGLLLMQGVCGAQVRNNLIFNNAKQGVMFYNYDSTDKAIASFDQTGNVLEFNTIWVGSRDPQGRYPTHTYAAILLHDTTSAKRGTLGGNIFRGNILVTSGGAVLQFQQGKFADTTIVENNLLYRAAGQEGVLRYGPRVCGFDEFCAMSPTFKANRYEPPPFRRAAADDFDCPDLFDFRLDDAMAARR